MPLIPKPNYNQIFASQAPDIDKPAVFNNYPEGWGPESRPNNGKPTIKGFNYLQQTSDLKDLWILQNGACLPYDESIEYAEGAPVLKDGVIQYKTANGFKSRDAVTIPTYNNAADGVDPVTGVANGAYFNVRSENDDTIAVEYKNVDGSAVATGKSYPSESYVKTISEYTALPFKVGKSYTLYERVQLDNGDIVKNTIEGNTNNPNENMNGWKLEGQDLIDSSQSSFSALIISDLLEVKNPKPCQKKYVSSVDAWYTYYPDTNQPENGVTVVSGWVMDTQPAYYASWFATPDVQSDQKAALAVGYAYATLKKRPFIIDAKYWVNLTADSQVGLPILSESKLIFIKGRGSLNALPTSATIYQILLVYQVSNYEVWDAELNGDRLNHIGTTGEWGHGLAIWDNSDGYIHRPVIKNCWGDGIDIGRKATTGLSSEPTRVTIFEPYIERCRRNGISPRSSDTCRIIRPTIRYIGDSDGIIGTWPKAGIDIEPNDATGTNAKPYHKDLIIESPTVENCFAALYVYNFFGSLVEARITGTSRFHASNAVVMGFWGPHIESEGFVDIERVIVSGPVYSGIQCGIVAASKFYVRVGEIVLDKSVAGTFTVNGSYNGFSGAEGEVGNADFTFTIPDGVHVSRTIQESDMPYTIGMQVRASPTSTNRPTTYTTLTAGLPLLSKNFYVDGITTRAETSASLSRRYSSTIKLKTDTDTAVRTIATNGDFSERTIIYDLSSAVTTYGIRVGNLVLTIGGVAKTSASTTELGASITFRNVQGGQTQIINMTGSWTFS